MANIGISAELKARYEKARTKYSESKDYYVTSNQFLDYLLELFEKSD